MNATHVTRRAMRRYMTNWFDVFARSVLLDGKRRMVLVNEDREQFGFLVQPAPALGAVIDWQGRRFEVTDVSERFDGLGWICCTQRVHSTSNSHRSIEIPKAQP